ncbi:Protein LAZ1 [Linum perenne]
MRYLVGDLASYLGYSPPIWATLIGGAFMALSLSLSCYLLLEHLSAYKNPEEQKFLIGVILMVPFYAIESFISLVHPSISVDVGILRDCYESFAMYCFGRYLVACLGGEERAIEFMDRQGRASTKTPLLENAKDKGAVKHPFPMNYFLKPWRLGQWFYQVVKFGIVQYMGIASAVHLYVFPAKPYALMGDRFTGTISVLGDYASVDCPIDPDEVRDSERPTKLRLPQPDEDVKSKMTLKESVRDIVVGGGGFIVNDVKFTVTQAVEPVEKGITKFNAKLHKISENIRKHDKDKKRTKDDSCLSSPSARVIRGIDDPLLNGSVSDSGAIRTKKHHQRRKTDYNSAESGGESSSDQNYGGYQVRGRRWITKD